MGQGAESPYWTLRHPEWGGLQGYNATLAAWERGTPILKVPSAQLRLILSPTGPYVMTNAKAEPNLYPMA